MRMKSFFSRNKYIFAAFFAPALLVTLAFAVTGIYPFGDRQIAVIDMYHQYVPFLSELQYKLQEGGSLFYTWNGAGGSNFWNLLAYYGASPLNLLLILFPQKLIMEAVAVLLLIKIGLAGSFMALYLRYATGRCDMATVAFASLYALCAYVMGYYWCIMWIDAVALLPLCILGLNRLIDEGRAVLYTVSLALTVFCNYYIAIMVCLFILCYYPVLYFLKRKGEGVKRCAVTTGKAVGFSLTGVLMAACMLLPTWISMQNTYYISADMPENWLFYNDVLDVLNQLLPNAELTYREGLPNLYCGIIIVILLVFYVISRTFSLREKILNMGFLVFLLLCLNINKLDFIWHGFHFPNQLPYRYTFVISFLLVGIAYRTFLRIDEVKISALWGVLAAGTGYYLLAQKLLKNDVDDISLFFYGGVAWLALYCIALVVYRKGYVKRSLLPILMAVLILSEMAANTCTSFDKVGNTVRSSYFENSQDIEALAAETRKEFVRTEMDDCYVLNCPALYHYRGISQFSSSINANTTALMEKIGIEGEPGKNRFNYNQTGPVTNAMLNIKYLISKSMPVDDSDFTLVKKAGNSSLYESKYPLSIGYMTGDEIRTWDYQSENPFTVLDDYVRAATANACESVFYSIGEPELSASNAAVEKKGDGSWQASSQQEGKESRVVLTYRSEKTQKYYVFVEADNAGTITVEREKDGEDLEIREDCGSVVNIGTVARGETFRIAIDYDAGDAGGITCHVRAMDEETWEAAYEILSQDMMEVTDYGDTYLQGTVEASEDGVLVTSIPYEKGWSLQVDGEDQQISELVGGVFLSIPLDAGSHKITLRFRPPGLLLGFAVTLAAVLLLTVCELLRRRSEKRRSRALAGSVLPDADESVDGSRDLG